MDISFNWRYANDTPVLSCDYKCQPEDFKVDEVPLFGPDQFSNSGEHVFLQVEKKEANTEWVAKILARFAEIPVRDVSFAGMKDRDAVTTQWFSLRIPGKREFDWPALNDDKIRILHVGRHQKKLRRGYLAGNRFTLLLKNCQGDQAIWQQRLQQVKERGVPNYFGPQRFGWQGKNIQSALEMLDGKRVKRQQKSIYLSALRSYLFNHVLSERIGTKTIQTPLVGDIMNLAGSNSVFTVEHVDDELANRLECRDIALTGPLVGKSKNSDREHTAAGLFEKNALIDYQGWQVGLIKQGLEADRRPLLVYPDNFSWQWLDETSLQLTFFLPKGSFATSVLRELANFQSPEKQ